MPTLPIQEPIAIFLIVLAMILIAPVLLRKIGVPPIVGMIVAGAVIGPYGLNLLARDASFEIFGGVGILYLMFLAGVEIDIPSLKKNWKRGVRFGLISFALPLIGGLAVCRYIMDMDWLQSALIGSMLSSHTLISYPIVARFSLSNTRGSVIAVCGTIVAVLLSLLVLAEVVQMKMSGAMDWGQLCLQLLYTAVYAIGVWIVLRWATKQFFRRYSDSVTQYVFILCEVLAASLLASFIGLEGILGAFWAGLVLNSFIPSRSPIMSRTIFVGNAIFIPYFLIGVGMLMNLKVIVSSWSIIFIAALITLTALSGKWIAARIVARSAHERQLIFGLSSGKAAATIAATIIGYRYGIISEDVMNAAVIMILLCCAVASVVTEYAAKRIRMNMERDKLEEDPHRRAVFARQLVAVANPMTAEGLTRMAIYMRHPRNTHPMYCLYIRTGDDGASVNMGRTALSDALMCAASVDVPVQEIERFDTNIVGGLTNTLKEKDCTELIIGLHRRGNIVDSFFGAMSENLLRATNKMIIMSRCFVPVATLHRVVVSVPSGAEYETGFALWLTRVCMLCTQLSAEVVFITYPETARYISGAIHSMGFTLQVGVQTIESWDDFITTSVKVTDEDLFIIIGARKSSISYSSDMEALPAYLSRYFARHNLLIIYPEQFGEEAELPAPTDFLATNIATSASLHIKDTIRRFVEACKLTIDE